MLGWDPLLRAAQAGPVLVAQEACLRSRHRRSPCQACSEVCPEVAVLPGRKPAIDPERCTRCGLCAGACPTAALQVDGLVEEDLLRADAGGAAVRLRCAHGPAGGRTVPCLGWLTADHLVDLGLQAPAVELAAGRCDGCRLAAGGARARAAVQAAGGLLAALGRAGALCWLDGAGAAGAGAGGAAGAGAGGPAGAGAAGAAGAAPPATRAQDRMSRRELFALWRGQGARTARAALPERDLNPLRLPARVPARRTRWLRRAPAPAAGAAGSGQWPPGSGQWPPGSGQWLLGGAGQPWAALAVAPGCTGCGICAAFCPTGALAAAANEAEGTWTLSHQPAACVNCGTCASLCPARVIGAADAIPVAALVTGRRRELARLGRVQCAGCRRPFWAAPGRTHCTACGATRGLLGWNG